MRSRQVLHSLTAVVAVACLAMWRQAVPTSSGKTPTVDRSARTSWVYHHGIFDWPGDYSYSAQINYLDTTGHAPGGYDDIAVTLTGPWGAWQPYSLSYHFNARPYASLTFALKPTQSGQVWSCQFIKVGDIPVGISVDVADYGPTPTAGKWSTYSIPLSALGVADTSIYKFAIQDQTGRPVNTWYVDNVAFTS